jgi:hypothetical protein
VSSRERKRAERRKRKQRSAETESATPEAVAAPSANGSGAAGEADHRETVEDIAAEAAARGVSKSEIRNERAREALDPLEEGERPLVVTLGALLSAGIALVTVGAWLAGAEVDGEKPGAFQVFAPSILFAVMAAGMWNRRYWAVLGFQAVMGILMVGSFLSLVGATSAGIAITSAVVLGAAGTFFWFTVKALARIQMPDKHLPK